MLLPTIGGSHYRLGTAQSNGIFQPPFATMWTGDLPGGWTQRYREDFTRSGDLPEGSFKFKSSNSSLDPTCAAYQYYYNSMNGYPDGQQDTSHLGQMLSSSTMSVVNGILTVNQRIVGGVPSGGHFHPIEDGVSPTNGAYRRGPYRRMRYRFRSSGTGPGYGFVGLFISNPWPDGGELDFLEGDVAESGIYGNYHFADPNGGFQGFGPAPGKSKQDFHTYDIIWTPGRVLHYCDEYLMLGTTDRVSSAPMAAHFQGATTGQSDGKTPPAAGVTGKWEIDFVEIYDYTP